MVLVPVALGTLRSGALLVLPAFGLSILAARGLLANADNPSALTPAIQQTIIAAHLAAVLVAIGLVAQRLLS
jgi:1,4-dihydroxy-2-naphthoate octaprenyltransferase